MVVSCVHFTMSHCGRCSKTIHEITRNGTKLFVLVRVISWIVLNKTRSTQPPPRWCSLDRSRERLELWIRDCVGGDLERGRAALCPPSQPANLLGLNCQAQIISGGTCRTTFPLTSFRSCAGHESPFESIWIATGPSFGKQPIDLPLAPRLRSLRITIRRIQSALFFGCADVLLGWSCLQDLCALV